MTTIDQRTAELAYSHTIGLSTMQGRGFYYPSDTEIGHDGRVYTVSRSLDGDTRGVRVTVYDVDSNYFGTFGEYGSGDGQFIWPTAIAIDEQGNSYIADEELNRITLFDADWNFTANWGESGSGAGQLDGPSGLAFDPAGNLLVADHHNNRIQVFTPAGEHLSEFGSAGSGPGELDLPWGISVGGAGEIFVADWANDRIQKFGSNGEFIASIGSQGRGDGQLSRPASVAIHPNGNIYVADWGNERVQVFDRDGQFIAKTRGEATDSKWANEFLSINVEEAQARLASDLEPDYKGDSPHEESSLIEKYFWAPLSVKFDGQGRLYVTESNRHRVQIYSTSV